MPDKIILMRTYANILIAIFIAACLGLLGLVFWQFIANSFISTFLISQGILYITFLIVGMWVILQGNLEARLVLANCAAAVGICTYMVEIFLDVRWLDSDGYTTTLKNVAVAQGHEYDPRSAIQVFEDLNAQGTDIFPFFGGASLLARGELPILPEKVDGLDKVIVPLAGRSKSLTIFCNESGQHLLYESDRYGFNNEDWLWNLNEIDIAVVGDSLVHGVCVEREENLTSKMGYLSSKIINLGITGNGPLLNLAMLREYGSLLRPKTLIWVYYEGNDMGNLRNEWTHESLRRYLEPGFEQKLSSSQSEIDQYLTNLVSLFYTRELEGITNKKTSSLNFSYQDLFLLRTVRNLLDLSLGSKYPEVTEKDHFALRLVLEAAKKEIARWNGQLVFVFLPAKRHLSWKKRPYWEQERIKVINLVDALGLISIDLTAPFEELDNPQRLFFSKYSHPNPEGYAFFARSIGYSLKEKGISLNPN